jgi:S-adenosylmethionine:tRNA ribosyltransferase-isomerase
VVFLDFRLSDFDYDLPEALIAQRPADRRDASRLLHLRRETGAVTDRRFAELPELLREGDVLVVNDTRVIPAKFFTRRVTGGRIEGLFLQAGDQGEWEVLLKGAGKCRDGERLTFEAEGVDQGIELIERLGGGKWRVRPEPAGPAEAILDRVGTPPLPPYIQRDAGSNSPADQQRYQTVYAQSPGAVAAPTAGLHFTPEILSALSARGIEQVSVTLHVGLGTFRPVSAENLDDHDMHFERYVLSGDAADRINLAKRDGRRIVAVGTTSVRVLESVAAAHGGQVTAASGETNLFLKPPSPFHVTDALLTNFHLPKSTLLMLISSFADPCGTSGVATILAAYRHAVEQQYRFFSYGDAMLIE